ncbi:MAG: hypothetical protein Fur006_37520 [Coleofasciculaceae cyanobacterium]
MGNQRVIQSKTTEVNLQKNSAIASLRDASRTRCPFGAIARSTPNPSFSTRTPVHPLLQLQRQIGNQAVSRLIQAKLKVGKPNDVYEQEADRVADTVMRMPNPLVQRQTEEEDKAQAKPLEGAIAPFVQRQAEENKEETAQTKPLAIEIRPWVQRQPAEEKKEEPVQMLQRQATEEKKEEPVQMLQRQATEEKKEEPVQMLQRQTTEDKKEEPVQAKEGIDGTTDVTPELENRIQTMRGGGQSLSESSLAFFEPRFGYNFRNVRVHTDSQASEISLKLNAQAFTIGQDIFFSAGHYEPNTSKGQWLLAHELTHTVQQQPQPLSTAPGSVQASTKSAIARSSVPSLLLTNHRGAENTEIREEGRGRSSFLLHSCLQTDSRLLVQRQPLAVSSAAPQIQRSVLDRVLNRVADWAANIPGFTLLTVILGRNPINGRSVERNAINVLRGFMGLIPGGDLLFRGLQASGVIDRVFAWVNQQLSQFGLTPSTILERFRRVDLSASDIFHPWDAIDRFRNIFLNPTLNSIRAFASTFGSRVIAFIKEAILRPIGQFARRIPLYPLLTVLLGRDPITGETVERNATNVIHGILTIIPGGEQVFQNLRQSGVIERAFAWFNEQITRLNLTWNAIRELFSRAWDSLSINDLVSPVAAFERIGNIFAPFVQSIRTFVPAAIGKVAEFIFEGVLSLAGGLGQRVLGIVRRAGGVISQIINNPIGFVGNLVGAVRRGFQLFSNNILTHLRAGLIGWLFGALQGAGLTLPERFDLRGIVSIVMQVLGLTYARLRAILVRLLGEERVSRAEQVFDFLVTIATQGLSAAWERIVEFAGNLQEMVIGGIRDWVARTVVGQAIARLVTLFNPAGAVIQAIMAIYNTVVFFIERAQQIAALAEAVFGSIASIAAGNISAAASYVERTMARTIPVVISFLARFIGLGNVSEQIRNIIQRIQAPIENAMNRVANWIATQVRRLGGAIMGTGRNTGTPDTRRPDEQMAALRTATTEASQIVQSERNPVEQRRALDVIKQRHRITTLEVVTDTRNDSGRQVHIHAAVNPTWNGEGFLISEMPPGPAVVIVMNMANPVDRAGHERVLPGPTTVGLPASWVRAHLVGAGFGQESPHGIFYAPGTFNGRVQNSNIELAIRGLYAQRIISNAEFQLTASAEPHPTPPAPRLAHVKYHLIARNPGGRWLELLAADFWIADAVPDPRIRPEISELNIENIYQVSNYENPRLGIERP